MRKQILFVALLAASVLGCEDDVLPTNPPVIAHKAKPAAPASAAVALTRVDTAGSSSICKATVRARARARARLDEMPADAVARRKAADFDALVSDACK